MLCACALYLAECIKITTQLYILLQHATVWSHAKCYAVMFSIIVLYMLKYILGHIAFVVGDNEPRCSHSIWEEARVQQDAICQVGMHFILCYCVWHTPVESG